MECEVFILPNGKSFPAWEVRFGVPQQHVETGPCTHHESDGSSRNGTIRVTVETAEVSFWGYPGSFDVGQKGQLSSVGDQFFDVTITSIEPAGDHVVVSAKVSRKVKFEWDR